MRQYNSGLRETERISEDGEEPTENELFEKACELADQGFGDFEVCLSELTLKKGHMLKTKDALSQRNFHKHKNKVSKKN